MATLLGIRVRPFHAALSLPVTSDLSRQAALQLNVPELKSCARLTKQASSDTPVKEVLQAQRQSAANYH